MELPPDFRELLSLLNSHGVEYLLVGGYALAAHGHPRYTGDIDFWVAPRAENLQRVVLALHRFGFGSLGIKAEDFAPDFVVQLGHPPRRIDLLTTIDGVDFDACFARRERVVIDGVELPIIGIDDFKANKRASGRAKDIADLESLEPRSGVDDAVAD